METGKVPRLDPGVLSGKSPLSTVLCGPWLCLLGDYPGFIIPMPTFEVSPGNYALLSDSVHSCHLPVMQIWRPKTSFKA